MISFIHSHIIIGIIAVLIGLVWSIKATPRPRTQANPNVALLVTKYRIITCGRLQVGAKNSQYCRAFSEQGKKAGGSDIGSDAVDVLEGVCMCGGQP